MAQLNITQGLFGFTPADVQRQLDQQGFERDLAMAQNPVAGFGAMGLQSLRRGTQTLQQGLFGVEPPEMAEANALERAKQAALPALQSGGQLAYLDALAGELERMGLTNQAVQARMLADQQRATAAEQQSQIALREAQAAKATQEQQPTIKTPASFAAVGSQLGIAPKPNLADYTQQEAQLINNEIQQNKEKESAAGVPQPGEVRLPDLNIGTQIVDRFTKEPSERLGTVRQIRTLLVEAKGGTGSAVPQLQRQLVKLVGDSQIGQNEVRQALGSIGIVGDVVSGINQLFTGTPSKEKLRDVEKVIDALEQAHAQAYNRGRDRAKTVLSNARFDTATVDSLIPSAYEFKGTPDKQSKFKEGAIYTDAQNNRAVYRNGKFEPIQ